MLKVNLSFLTLLCVSSSFLEARVAFGPRGLLFLSAGSNQHELHVPFIPHGAPRILESSGKIQGLFLCGVGGSYDIGSRFSIDLSSYLGASALRYSATFLSNERAGDESGSLPVSETYASPSSPLIQGHPLVHENEDLDVEGRAWSESGTQASRSQISSAGLASAGSAPVLNIESDSNIATPEPGSVELDLELARLAAAANIQVPPSVVAHSGDGNQHTPTSNPFYEQEKASTSEGWFNWIPNLLSSVKKPGAHSPSGTVGITPVMRSLTPDLESAAHEPLLLLPPSSSSAKGKEKASVQITTSDDSQRVPFLGSEDSSTYIPPRGTTQAQGGKISPSSCTGGPAGPLPRADGSSSSTNLPSVPTSANQQNTETGCLCSPLSFFGRKSGPEALTATQLGGRESAPALVARSNASDEDVSPKMPEPPRVDESRLGPNGALSSPPFGEGDKESLVLVGARDRVEIVEGALGGLETQIPSEPSITAAQPLCTDPIATTSLDGISTDEALRGRLRAKDVMQDREAGCSPFGRCFGRKSKFAAPALDPGPANASPTAGVLRLARALFLPLPHRQEGASGQNSLVGKHSPAMATILSSEMEITVGAQDSAQPNPPTVPSREGYASPSEPLVSAIDQGRVSSNTGDAVATFPRARRFSGEISLPFGGLAEQPRRSGGTSTPLRGGGMDATSSITPGEAQGMTPEQQTPSASYSREVPTVSGPYLDSTSAVGADVSSSAPDPQQGSGLVAEAERPLVHANTPAPRAQEDGTPFTLATEGLATSELEGSPLDTAPGGSSLNVSSLTVHSSSIAPSPTVADGENWVLLDSPNDAVDGLVGSASSAIDGASMLLSSRGDTPQIAPHSEPVASAIDQGRVSSNTGDAVATFPRARRFSGEISLPFGGLAEPLLLSEVIE